MIFSKQMKVFIHLPIKLLKDINIIKATNPNGKVCFKCGSTTHMLPHCPEYKKGDELPFYKKLSRPSSKRPNSHRAVQKAKNIFIKPVFKNTTNKF